MPYNKENELRKQKIEGIYQQGRKFFQELEDNINRDCRLPLEEIVRIEYTKKYSELLGELYKLVTKKSLLVVDDIQALDRQYDDVVDQYDSFFEECDVLTDNMDKDQDSDDEEEAREKAYGLELFIMRFNKFLRKNVSQEFFIAIDNDLLDFSFLPKASADLSVLDIGVLEGKVAHEAVEAEVAAAEESMVEVAIATNDSGNASRAATRYAMFTTATGRAWKTLTDLSEPISEFDPPIMVKSAGRSSVAECTHTCTIERDRAASVSVMGRRSAF